MEDRTVIEWDKDDLDALGMLKVDVLALGMLTCIRKRLRPARAAITAARLHARRRAAARTRRSTTCCRSADSVGVFQVESRAQMSMLPRLKPRSSTTSSSRSRSCARGRSRATWCIPTCAGGEGEPSTRRTYPDPRRARAGAGARRCGVPLFQEQAMQIAIVAAGFTPDEADQLRRAMATFRHVRHHRTASATSSSTAWSRSGYAARVRRALLQADRGLRRVRLPREPRGQLRAPRLCLGLDQVPLPRRVLRRASSTASRWASTQPAQLVRDAREHGVEVRPIDVN